MVSILLALFIFITATLLCQLSASHEVSAASPPFVRQEIQDGLNDVITINDCNSTITKLNKSSNTQLYQMFNSLDIQRVSYSSDGKILNATIWLNLLGLDSHFLPPENYPLNFGILADVNPNPVIGIGGVNYHKEVANYQIPDLPVQNGDTTNSWVEDTHEALSNGPHRYLKVSEQNYNYTRVFQQLINKTGSVYYLPLSLDLRTLAFPDRYKVMFYTLSSSDRCNRIIDFTSWIDIPPPRFVISTFPNTIEVRPGIAKDIGVVLKSTTGFVPEVASFTNLENYSGIQVFPDRGKLNRSPISDEPVSFNIKVPENTLTGEYTIPMLANISTGSAIPSEFVGVNKYNSYIPSESFVTAIANLTITVLEPLTVHEWFKEGWDTYGGFISLFGGGFAAGGASLVFDRLRRKSKKRF